MRRRGNVNHAALLVAAGGGGSWSAASLAALASDSNSWGNYTMRQRIAASVIPKNGTKVRFSLRSSSTIALTLTKAAICQKAAGTFDCTTTPTPVTFDGGNAGFTVGTSTTKMSDDITFTMSTANDYVFIWFVANGEPNNSYTATVFSAGSGIYDLGWKGGGDDVASTTATGYTTWNDTLFLDDLEVFG